jgi:hypothetical protein
MGAPVGNKNATRAKQWQLAIERALDKRGASNRTEALDALAEKLLQQCDAGDMTALKELGDRLDGKPAQTIGGIPGGEPIQVILGSADGRL